MPSPFSKKVKREPTEQRGVKHRAVTNSELHCEYCYHISTEGTYYPDDKVLVWNCDGCEILNVVKDINL